MAEQTSSASLLEKYKGAESADPSHTIEFHEKILSFKPQWENYEATSNNAQLLRILEIDAPANKNKAIITGNLNVLRACIEGLKLAEEKPLQWILTLFHDILREDSSCYSLFEEGLKNGIAMYEPIMSLLQRSPLDAYVADKAAWLLGALIGYLPGFFSESQVVDFSKMILESSSPLTDLGVLDALTNILKTDVFRKIVWSQPGVSEVIFKVEPKTAQANPLYKCIFALWMLSFDADIKSDLKKLAVIKKVKDTLTYSRVEKVIRLCLTLLKNLMANKDLCEDVVEENLVECVQILEYEKWRDSELYDDIHSMSSHIQTEVQEMSNFDRYERELQSGTLTKGFVHTSKFWAENVMKFETNDFRPIKMLAALLQNDGTDPTTLALACHDIGEFVALHPLGKRIVAQFNVKERVMELMGSTEPEKRDVRREALLCCQKIMLNKWQDIEK